MSFQFFHFLYKNVLSILPGLLIHQSDKSSINALNLNLLFIRLLKRKCHFKSLVCMGEFSLSGQHHALLPVALFILVFVHPEYTIDFLLNYNSPITPQGGGKTIMEKCINKSPYIYNGHRSTKLDF